MEKTRSIRIRNILNQTGVKKKKVRNRKNMPLCSIKNCKHDQHVPFVKSKNNLERNIEFSAKYWPINSSAIHIWQKDKYVALKFLFLQREEQNKKQEIQLLVIFIFGFYCVCRENVMCENHCRIDNNRIFYPNTLKV